MQNQIGVLNIPVAVFPDGSLLVVGERIPPDVLAFCEQRNLRLHVEAALRMVRQAFPSVQSLDVHLDRDPEETGEWIVIEVTSRADSESFLKACDQCLDLWVGKLPTEALNAIRLSYSLL